MFIDGFERFPRAGHHLNDVPAVAKRKLPPSVANKPKWGFAIPVDSWVDADFKAHLRDVLLDPSSRLPEFFRPEVYRPIIEAFCKSDIFSGISRQELCQRAIMLLSIRVRAFARRVPSCDVPTNAPCHTCTARG